MLARAAFAVCNMNVILMDFISGMCLGVELFLGEDLDPDDVFAIQFDLLIVRITYIRTKR